MDRSFQMIKTEGLKSNIRGCRNAGINYLVYSCAQPAAACVWQPKTYAQEEEPGTGQRGRCGMPEKDKIQDLVK